MLPFRRAAMMMMNQNIPMVTLPQNIVANVGTIIDSFDSTTGWSGSPVLNTSEVYEGTGSIKATTGVGTALNLDKSGSWDMSAGQNIIISIYNHGAIGDIDNITFYFANDGGFGAYFSCWKQFFSPGWNHVLIRKSDLGNTGGASWANPITKIRLKINPVAGKTGVVSFDRLMTNTQLNPFVMLQFDDATTTQYTKIFPILKAHRVRGTLFAVTGQLGNPGYLTTAQLLEMHGAGWAIANHTNTHANLSTLTQAEVQTELTTAQGVLDGLGMTRASKHVAYPGGVYNDTTLAAMAAAGMLTGRTVSGPSACDYIWPTLGDYIQPVRHLNNAISLVTAKGYIDTLVSTKRGMNLLVHGLSDAAAEENAWKTSDFQELVDYIVQQGVYCLTIADYWAARTGAISIPKAI